jgi:hypothetical protein
MVNCLANREWAAMAENPYDYSDSGEIRKRAILPLKWIERG